MTTAQAIKKTPKERLAFNTKRMADAVKRERDTQSAYEKKLLKSSPLYRAWAVLRDSVAV